MANVVHPTVSSQYVDNLVAVQPQHSGLNPTSSEGRDTLIYAPANSVTGNSQDKKIGSADKPEPLTPEHLLQGGTHIDTDAQPITRRLNLMASPEKDQLGGVDLSDTDDTKPTPTAVGPPPQFATSPTEPRVPTPGSTSEQAESSSPFAAEGVKNADVDTGSTATVANSATSTENTNVGGGAKTTGDQGTLEVPTIHSDTDAAAVRDLAMSPHATPESVGACVAMFLATEHVSDEDRSAAMVQLKLHARYAEGRNFIYRTGCIPQLVFLLVDPGTVEAAVATIVNLAYTAHPTRNIIDALVQANIVQRITWVLEFAPAGARKSALNALVNVAIGSNEYKSLICRHPGLPEQLVRCIRCAEEGINFNAARLVHSLCCDGDQICKPRVLHLTKHNVAAAIADKLRPENTHFVKGVVPIIYHIMNDGVLLFYEQFVAADGAKRVDQLVRSYTNAFGHPKSTLERTVVTLRGIRQCLKMLAKVRDSSRPRPHLDSDDVTCWSSSDGEASEADGEHCYTPLDRIRQVLDSTPPTEVPGYMVLKRRLIHEFGEGKVQAYRQRIQDILQQHQEAHAVSFLLTAEGKGSTLMATATACVQRALRSAVAEVVDMGAAAVVDTTATDAAVDRGDVELAIQDESVECSPQETNEDDAHVTTTTPMVGAHAAVVEVPAVADIPVEGASISNTEQCHEISQGNSAATAGPAVVTSTEVTTAEAAKRRAHDELKASQLAEAQATRMGAVLLGAGAALDASETAVQADGADDGDTTEQTVDASAIDASEGADTNERDARVVGAPTAVHVVVEKAHEAATVASTASGADTAPPMVCTESTVVASTTADCNNTALATCAEAPGTVLSSPEDGIESGAADTVLRAVVEAVVETTDTTVLAVDTNDGRPCGVDAAVDVSQGVHASDVPEEDDADDTSAIPSDASGDVDEAGSSGTDES
eukprot:m.940223 g.940223  ORF g.940223 m.940223 type:complete len:939 (+) comp23826_c0_seq2:319-3135(+)